MLLSETQIRDTKYPTRNLYRGIVAGLTVLLATSTALADHFTGEDDVTGRIAIVDTEQRSVVLTNGMTFFVSESISIEGLKLGDAVMVTFRTESGRIIAVKLSRSDLRV